MLLLENVCRPQIVPQLAKVQVVWKVLWSLSKYEEDMPWQTEYISPADTITYWGCLLGVMVRVSDLQVFNSLKLLFLIFKIVRRLVYHLRRNFQSPSQDVYNTIQDRHKSIQAIPCPYRFLFSTYICFPACYCRLLWVCGESEYWRKIPVYEGVEGSYRVKIIFRFHRRVVEMRARKLCDVSSQ